MNSRANKKWLMTALAALIVVALGVVGFRYWQKSGAEVYRVFNSPDKQFQIVVFRNPAIFAMPGHSSDSPGYFQLRDTRSGLVLRESKVEMVQLVDQVEWSETHVDVRLLAEWSLPK
jgi:hypothetical protein